MTDVSTDELDRFARSSGVILPVVKNGAQSQRMMLELQELHGQLSQQRHLMRIPGPQCQKIKHLT